MKVINTIDLWTEQYSNQQDCFNGAFIDGFKIDKIPFDTYKIVKNCNCYITLKNKDISITNKHQAIVFYKENKPVRLVVLNEKTDIEKCISAALNQPFGDGILKDCYEKNHITSYLIDKKEKPIYNECVPSKEVDTGSCDRWSLLFNMLKGKYTESDTEIGNFNNEDYEFLYKFHLTYELNTDTEIFVIEHFSAFINTDKTRIIPIQTYSALGLGSDD